MRDVYGFGTLVAQTHHLAESAIGNEVDSRNAKTRGQDPIKSRGRATALYMTQHAHPNFFVGTSGDCIADQVSHRSGTTIFFQFGGQFNAFSDHDDRKPLTVTLARFDELAD